MKIYIFNKSKILLIFFVILIIITLLIVFFINQSPNCLAIEFGDNSTYSSEFKDKISNLTIGEEKIAYLTFDDGPNRSITPKILDILKAEDIKATFFVIGKYVEDNPEIVKRAYEEGHYIANHGYDHNNNNLYKSKTAFMEEIKKTDMAIGNAIGVENYCSYVFRFPNGFMAPANKSAKEEAVKLLQKMGYAYIDWNCLNNDSEKKYTQTQLVNNLINSSKGKNTLVILMHDTNDVNDSSLVLKDSISYLKSQGYEFANFYNLIENNSI